MHRGTDPPAEGPRLRPGASRLQQAHLRVGIHPGGLKPPGVRHVIPVNVVGRGDGYSYLAAASDIRVVDVRLHEQSVVVGMRHEVDIESLHHRPLSLACRATTAAYSTTKAK